MLLNQLRDAFELTNWNTKEEGVHGIRDMKLNQIKPKVKKNISLEVPFSVNRFCPLKVNILKYAIITNLAYYSKCQLPILLHFSAFFV